MKENYQRSLALLTYLEGGQSHHIEGDPGGHTSGLGITQSTYDRYRKGKKLPLRFIDEMEVEERDDILKGGYWDVCQCDDIPSELDLVVYQYAINRGPTKAIKILQRAVGVKADGYLGPISMMEIHCCDIELTMEKFLDYQYHWYVHKRKEDKFTKGLASRVIKTAKFLDFPYSPPDEPV